MPAPSVVVFDVNETLSDMTPLDEVLAGLGAPELAARVWFASLLRDGFALAATGTSAPFSALADGALRTVLSGIELSCGPDEAVSRVMDAFMGLSVHGDVPDGVAALAAAGARLVTLTNGTTEVTEALLDRAGLLAHFERLLSVRDAGIWKPAPGSYSYAAETCGVQPAQMLMVAVHPWDIDGARRAGLETAWLDRDGRPYPDYFLPPHHTVTTVGALAGIVGPGVADPASGSDT